MDACGVLKMAVCRTSVVRETCRENGPALAFSIPDILGPTFCHASPPGPVTSPSSRLVGTVRALARGARRPFREAIGYLQPRQDPGTTPAAVRECVARGQPSKMPSGAPWRVASAGARHPLQAQLSGMSSGVFEGEDEEELSLLPPAGSSHGKTVHKHSLSGQLDTQWHAFQVAMFKPPEASLLENGGGGGGAEGEGGAGSSRSSSQTSEPFLAAVKDLQPSKKTSEWLMVGLTLLPKISWWVGAGNGVGGRRDRAVEGRA